MRELRVVKSFRKDMKKLSKNEIEKTKALSNSFRLTFLLSRNTATISCTEITKGGANATWSRICCWSTDDNTLYLALLRISSHTNIFSVKKSF